MIVKNNLKNTFYGFKNQFLITTKFLKKITEALKIDFVSSVVYEKFKKKSISVVILEQIFPKMGGYGLLCICFKIKGLWN